MNHRELIAPVKTAVIWGAALQAFGAAVGVIPFIAVAELGKQILSDHASAYQTWLIIAVSAASLILRFVLQSAAASVAHHADIELQFTLRKRLAEHFGALPIGWFAKNNHANVQQIIQSDVAAMHHFVGHGYNNIVAALVTPIVAISYLIWSDWHTAVIACIPAILGIGLYVVQFQGYQEKISKFSSSLNDIEAAVGEFTQGISTIKVYAQGQQADRRLGFAAAQFIRSFREWIDGMKTISAVTEIILSPMIAFGIALTTGMFLYGQSGFSQSLPLLVLAPALTAPFMVLAFSKADMQIASESLARISELLETPVQTAGSVPSTPVGHRIVFDKVSFGYSDDTPLLQDIDLVLEPGSFTAVVGPSGVGKSTLAELLLRFWEPCNGHITLGGVPLDDVSDQMLHSKVGFVFQDVQLIRASIADNIALADPGASQEAIRAAAQAARIDERVQTMPRGYQSVIGQDVQLSGGEAQRISIARTFLKDAPVLVLDEATAFIDPNTEKDMQLALLDLNQNRTVLMIAHQLESVVKADQICVLQRGRIVERGNHTELQAQNGLYRKMWDAYYGDALR
jgi:ATP-binding cassette subfamily B protein